MSRMDILERLDRGDISVKKAITLLKLPAKPKRLPKGNIMKVRVFGDGKGFSIPIPLLLVYVAYFLFRLIFGLVCLFTRNREMREAYVILRNIHHNDIKVALKSLRLCKSTGFIEVSDGEEGVEIKIV